MYGNKTLEAMNIEQLKSEIPSIIFVTIIMVLGIIGNVHTILVYVLFYGKGNHKHYVLWLSTFDLLACCITIPMFISKHVNTYTYPTDISCQLSMYLSSFFAGFNLALLDIIATDRYRRISSPLKKQLSHKGGQTACIVTCVLFLILSVPNLLIYHAKEITLPNSEHVGYSCYMRDEHDMFDTVYTIIQSIVVVFLLTFCIVLYSLVLWNLVKLGKVRSASRSKISMRSVLGFIRSCRSSLSNQIISKHTRKNNEKQRKCYWNPTAEYNTNCVSTVEMHDIEVTCQTEVDFAEESNQNTENSYHKDIQTENMHTLMNENDHTERIRESKDDVFIPTPIRIPLFQTKTMDRNTHFNCSVLKIKNLDKEYETKVNKSHQSHNIAHGYETNVNKSNNRDQIAHGYETKVNKPRQSHHITKGRRVTVMFMVVSVGACIVYLPTIILKILIAFYFGDNLFETTLQGWFGVLGYFYMLNHAINPIVYGFLDSRFRQKCQKMYSKSFFLCRKKHVSNQLNTY